MSRWSRKTEHAQVHQHNVHIMKLNAPEAFEPVYPCMRCDGSTRQKVAFTERGKRPREIDIRCRSCKGSGMQA